MKYTKAEADYLEPLLTVDRLPCVICRSFDSYMRTCRLVAGRISPGGSCKHHAGLTTADIVELIEAENVRL